jgi:S-adenosylmethionine:tRNA ribosyltransferase-isomerase
VKNIELADYTYQLPQDKIAKYGLAQRDHSKLLYYRKNQIAHHNFHQLPDLLPPQSTLFFNNTKVIQARLKLKRNTGAIIEVFLLSPDAPQETILSTLESTEPVVYHCMIGNLKKWKDNEILTEEISINNRIITLKAQLLDRKAMVVKFSWNDAQTKFSDIIDHVGHTPLPPYLNRSDEPEDKERYQTVYSQNPGAVAAPTAGLHFTNEILEKLAAQGTTMSHLTLHVSAGTFQPIKVDKITDHPMHSERVIINRKNVEDVISAKTVVAVGTTALRTLESSYWYGVQLLITDNPEFNIAKLTPYDIDEVELPSRKVAFEAILAYMDEYNFSEISGETEIFIFPGYDFKVCDALITNFHQPGSTLILLIAAFVGENWRKIYQEALKNNYRFLSYGDSSLLIK